MPTLVFVKDLSLAKQNHLNELFKDLDTGPPDEIEDNNDHDSDLENEFDSDGETVKLDRLEQELNHDTESTAKDLNSEYMVGEAKLGKDKSKVSEFRQDLYGLQHDVLMHKVVTAKQSSKFRPVVVSDIADPKTHVDGYSRFEMKRFVKKERQISYKKEKAKLVRRMHEEEKLSREMLDNYIEQSKDLDELDNNDDKEFDIVSDTRYTRRPKN